MKKIFKKIKPYLWVAEMNLFVIGVFLAATLIDTLIVGTTFFVLDPMSFITPARAEWNITVPKKESKCLDIDGYLKTIKINIKQFDGSIAYKANNPCNLKFANQPNATYYKGFAKYKTPELGYRACIMQIKLDQERNKTLEKFISIYAPEYENNTELYINTVAKNLNVDRKISIAEIDLLDLAEQIAKFESQTIIKST